MEDNERNNIQHFEQKESFPPIFAWVAKQKSAFSCATKEAISYKTRTKQRAVGNIIINDRREGKGKDASYPVKVPPSLL